MMLSEAKHSGVRLTNLREISNERATLVGGAIMEHIHEHSADLPTMREFWCPMCVNNAHPGCVYCRNTGWKDGIAPFVVDIFDR